jgi:preprotein translocase subunit SecB
MSLDAITIDSEVSRLKVENVESRGSIWLVKVEINQSIPEGKNIPYEFSLSMAGVVAVHPSFEGDQLNRAIQVNGPSMIFGAAREIIRGATSRGPFAPVIIPSTNFFHCLSPKDKESTPKSAAKSARKKPKKGP